MKKFKIFIASFIVTFAVMAVALCAVCGQILIKTQQAEVKKENVPVNIPSARDRVRLFLRLGNEDSRVYRIIKFNAIEGKIGIGIISPEFKIKDGYTIDGIYKQKGSLACVEEFKNAFGVNIDKYIFCSYDELMEICKDFKEIDIEPGHIPGAAKSYLLKNADKAGRETIIYAIEQGGKFLDNAVGLEFILYAAENFINTNLGNLDDLLTDGIKREFERINTDINTSALEDFTRIMSFLHDGRTFNTCFVTGDDSFESGAEKIKRVTD